MAMHRQLAHLRLPIANTPRLAATRGIHALRFSARLRQPNCKGAINLDSSFPLAIKGFHNTAVRNNSGDDSDSTTNTAAIGEKEFVLSPPCYIHS